VFVVDKDSNAQVGRSVGIRLAGKAEVVKS
jgi:hypothetical protein